METCDRCYKPIEDPAQHGLYLCPLEPRRSDLYVIGDDIPGGLEVKHGLCNPDGSPRKFYSKTEIRRAANEAGLTMGNDTPKPYRVNWSGITKNGK